MKERVLGQLVELVMIGKVIIRSNCNQNLITGLPQNCTCMFKHYAHAEGIIVMLKIPNPEVRKYSRRLEQFRSFVICRNACLSVT
jgi:hypothetical protein